MKRALRWMLLFGAIAGFSAIVYWQLYSPNSVRQKLVLTDKIYGELDHPVWSKRLARAKGHRPNYGSGDFRMLILVDVRRVSIPMSNAIAFYEREGERLGFKEFHVDAYLQAARKFQGEWSDLRIQVPQGDDIIVLSQRFPDSDGNVRRHEAIPRSY